MDLVRVKDLKCSETLLNPSPNPLLHLAAAAWINGRKNWNPDLAKHLAKTSRPLFEIIFDCSHRNGYGGLLYTYNNIVEIVEWEENNKKLLYRPRWLSKNMKRDSIVVKLQDAIEMDEFPHKKICKSYISD